MKPVTKQISSVRVTANQQSKCRCGGNSMPKQRTAPAQKNR